MEIAEVEHHEFIGLITVLNIGTRRRVPLNGVGKEEVGG